MHTLRGSSVYILQICSPFVLSSFTKKGEIESAFFALPVFWWQVTTQKVDLMFVMFYAGSRTGIYFSTGPLFIQSEILQEISGTRKFSGFTRKFPSHWRILHQVLVWSSTGIQSFSVGNASGNCPEISESPKIFHQVQIVKQYCLPEPHSRNFRQKFQVPGNFRWRSGNFRAARSRSSPSQKLNSSRISVARKFPGVSPEISELNPEISELAAANGQISGRGIYTPPPTSSRWAL